MDERKFPKLLLASRPGKPAGTLGEKLRSIVNAQGATVYQFLLGEFTIIFKTNGIWLERRGGEGMDLHPGKLEKLLKKYWEKEF